MSNSLIVIYNFLNSSGSTCVSIFSILQEIEKRFTKVKLNTC